MSAKVHQLFSDQSFGPDAVKAMGEAYDLACSRLPPDTDHEAVARSILLAANNGQHDVEVLCSAAVAAHERHRRHG